MHVYRCTSIHIGKNCCTDLILSLFIIDGDNIGDKITITQGHAKQSLGKKRDAITWIA